MEGAGWAAVETSTHQDHVIAHVLGANLLGHFEQDEALHLILDIGLLWSIFADAEMEILPETLAAAEMNLDAAGRALLKEDLHALHALGPSAASLAVVHPAPVGCRIEEVAVYTDGPRRMIIVRCEGVNFVVETSAETFEFVLREVSET